MCNIHTVAYCIDEKHQRFRYVESITICKFIKYTAAVLVNIYRYSLSVQSFSICCFILRYSDETEDEINLLAKSTLESLAKKWGKIFTEDLVESNIRLLKDHVKTFFNEILSETDKKEETILNRIEGNFWRRHHSISI